MNSIVTALSSASVIVCGDSADARKRVLVESAREFCVRSGFRKFAFPENISDSKTFFKRARTLLPIRSPSGLDRSAMNLDQVADVLFDWVPASGKTLICIPEVDKIQGIMAMAFTQLYIQHEVERAPGSLRFLVSEAFAFEPDYPLHIVRAESDARTTRDIARKLLTVVDIGTSDGNTS